MSKCNLLVTPFTYSSGMAAIVTSVLLVRDTLKVITKFKICRSVTCPYEKNMPVA